MSHSSWSSGLRFTGGVGIMGSVGVAVEAEDSLGGNAWLSRRLWVLCTTWASAIARAGYMWRKAFVDAQQIVVRHCLLRNSVA